MKRVPLAVLTLIAVAMLAFTAGSARVAARTVAQPVPQTDLLQVIPENVGGVVLVNVPMVTDSKLFTQDKLKNLLAKAQAEVAQLGFNMSDVRTAAIAFSSAKFSDPTVVVSGTFNQANIVARLRDNSKVKVASEKYKEFDVHSVTEVGKTDGMNFSFLGPDLVVAGTPASVRAAIDVRNGDKPGINKNAKLMDALSQNATSAIRFAFNVTPEMTKGLESSGLPLPNVSSINLIFGGIDVTDNVSLNATLRNDTAPNAKILADQLNSLFSLVKGLLGGSNDPKMGPIAEAIKGISITNNDVDVKIVGSVPAELIGQIIR